MSPVDGSPESQLSPQRFTRLCAELGRCLVLYQAIERSLKLLLPHMRASRPAAKGEVTLEWRYFFASKKSLGAFVEMLERRLESDDPASLKKSLRTLAKQRNEVVHRFYEQPFAKLGTKDEFQQAMEFLAQRRQLAAEWSDLLKDLLVQLHAAIDESSAGLGGAA
jgi:hypothetical protein